jgi:hypothetical protein
MNPTVEELRRRLRAHGRAGRGNPYPAELRRAVVAFVDESKRDGISAGACAKSLGIAAQTVARWREEIAFVRVEVDTSAPAALVVRGPCGVSVEGLDLGTIAALLRKLA